MDEFAPSTQAEQVSKACEEQEMVQAMKELAKRGATYATGCGFVDERDPFLEEEQIRMTMKRPRDSRDGHVVGGRGGRRFREYEGGSLEFTK